MAESSRVRPKFLNLFAIRLPVSGWASILHRISGFALFLALPWLIWLLDHSLRSPQSFHTLAQILANPFVKLVLIGLLWAFLHHFCMGIRILLIDIHVGVGKPQARASAIMVLAVSALLTLLLGVKLW